METLVASDDYAGGDIAILHRDDAATIANADDAEMNAEYEQPSWDNEERMEEEVEQGEDTVAELKPTDAFPPALEDGEEGETEEVMEYDQDASGVAAEEADEDGDIDIGEADEGADVVIADDIEQAEGGPADDSAYEQQSTENIQEVVLDDEPEEQQRGDAPEATELESDHQPVPETATESENATSATPQESDPSGAPSASEPTVEALTTDTLADGPEYAPDAESEFVAAQEPVVTEPTVGERLPKNGQQDEGIAEAASSSEKDAPETADVGGAEQAADTVENNDQAGEHSSSESWNAEEEDEVAIEPIRLSFQDQSFAIFSADPESTSYLAWDDETDTLKTVPAPRLDVEDDVFWSPLEALFNALRVKDALGEFLEGESGSELVMTFPELELTVREDNVYAREMSLTHLIRLHHQLGLRDSMHIRISEDSRFISQYNLLAQQIAQAQKQGAEDISGDEAGAPDAEEAVASTLAATAEDDRVNGAVDTASDQIVGASKSEAGAREEVDEASAAVNDEADPVATEEPADTQGESRSAGLDLSDADNASVDASVVQDAAAEHESDEQQEEGVATLVDGEDATEAAADAGDAEEEIIEYQEEGEERHHSDVADQEEGEVEDQSGSYEEDDVPDIGEEREEGQQGLDAEPDAEEGEEEGDYGDETQEGEGVADAEEADNVAEDPEADQWQGAEGEEEEQDPATEGDHAVYPGEEDAAEAADLGTADYEENTHEEVGETTAGSMNGDKAGAATSRQPESIANGASRKRHADDDLIEEESSETEAKKAKVT